MSRLILASTSSSRRAMLAKAGVLCDAMPPMVDESTIKENLLEQRFGPRELADALAEAKAVKLSGKYTDAVVIGADQILALDGGQTLDKPVDQDQAIAQLALMEGKTHKLLSAVVVAERGEPVWRHVAISRMTMRSLSVQFITSYVEQHWQDIRHCVGCYQVEAAGAQLFSRIEGSHFDIMGLPLLPLLAFLRDRKAIIA